MTSKIRKGRFLVWTAHVGKWETAHQEEIKSENRIAWIRDDMSSICWLGDEIAVADLPAKP